MTSTGIVASSIFATLKKLFKYDSVTGAASVELWVLLTTLLLVVRFLLDFFGPWYAYRAMAATVQVIQILNFSLVHYTLGLMQLSAKKVSDYFQIWAVLLVTLQYSVKTGRLYDRSKQMPVLDLMSSFWAASLIRMQTFFLLRIPLWLIWALNAIRIISYFASSDRAVTINQENMRLVSDYMRYEHTLSPSGDVAIGIQSYKYLVCGEDMVLRDARRQNKRSGYKIRLDPDNKKLVTIDKIWNVDSGSSGCGLLGYTEDTGNRLKDVCLSFALYKLLRRRFYNLPIHEASKEKTRQLVFNYILQGTDNYERAFRVTEVELSFLQDLFYSKQAGMFAAGFPVLSMMMSLFLVAATGYLAYPVHYIPERIDQADKGIITHGVIVTYIIIGLIVVKELSEVYLYVFSKWTKVLVICMYVKHSWLRHPVVKGAMRMLFWFIGGKWDQRIFQCNLLISYSRNQKHLTKRVKLESQVKTAVFDLFKGLQNHPERLEYYFLKAFGSNETLMKQLAWAVELEADTHRILVWHIATCLCEIHISAEVKKLQAVRHQRRRFLALQHYLLTAVRLSNYCAYLLNIALVPDNGIVITKILTAVRKETYRATGSSAHQSLPDIYDKLMDIATEPSKESEEVANRVSDVVRHVAPDGSVIYEQFLSAETANDEEDPNTTGGGSTTNSSIPATNREDTFAGDDDIHNSITQMGAKLGKQLIEAYGGDTIGLWRDLAVFWTGFLLNLAASTRAAKHKTRLVTKGELITHLWVLLSHAGFLGNTRHGQTLLDPHDLDEIDPLS